MTTVAKYGVKEIGEDYVVFQDSVNVVRVNFADDTLYPNFTKEDSAASFRGLEGKEVALPEPLRCDPPGRLFIAIDIWEDLDRSTRAIPNYFAVHSVEARYTKFVRHARTENSI